jgi:alpha-L-fucosidase
MFSWFSDVKFEIWAHWGPGCQPEQDDWYARRMYEEGSAIYRYHVEHYGHASLDSGNSFDKAP